MNNDEGNYYAIIPSYILHDKSLKPNEKLMYGQISSLTNVTGYCWAGNKVLGELLGIEPDTASRLVGNLEKAGYISRRVVRNEKNQVIKRYLAIMPRIPGGNPDDTAIEKPTGNKDDSTPTGNKSNRTNGQTSERTIGQTGKEILKGLSTTTRQLIKTEHPLAFYQRAFGKPATGLLNQTLQEQAYNYGNELVNYSFWLANDKGNGYPYAKAMLKSWIQDGLTTIADVEQAREKYKADQTAKKMARNNKSSGGYQQPNVVPIKTHEISFKDQLYNSYLNNDQDIGRTIKQYKLDGINLTPDQIRGVANERA